MSDEGCSSDEEAPRTLNLRHSVELRLDLESEESARIVCAALSVDKEPKRSNAVRELRQEGQFLLISVKSEDRRSLQKSTANLLDMCDLSLSTLTMAQGKKWLVVQQPQKAKKENKQEKNVQNGSGDSQQSAAKKPKLEG